MSPFPQYYMTVRPDSVSQYLIDGRIAVYMDNSQSAIICPTSFFEMFILIEDNYNRWTTASLLRVLRFFGFFLTIIITLMYISALTLSKLEKDVSNQFEREIRNFIQKTIEQNIDPIGLSENFRKNYHGQWTNELTDKILKNLEIDIHVQTSIISTGILK